MIIINTYIISTVFILLWTEWIDTIPFKWLQELRLTLNFKPFNCALCLSFWLGVIISLVSLNPIFVGLPLFVKYIENNI
jgi:hypothetical protein